MTTLQRPAPVAARSGGPSPLVATDLFVRRHIGPSEVEIAEMLALLGFDSLEAMTEQVLPTSIRLAQPLRLAGLDGLHGEHETLGRLRAVAAKNQVFRSYIGMGYHDCITPGVIQRNILENPGWYTQYTPYQAEISQGRLEALINFQTMVSDLTGLPLAGASLLDEGTAAAEAMALCHSVTDTDGTRDTFVIADDCHPQTIEVVRTRADALGFKIVVQPTSTMATNAVTANVFGVLLQYPTTDGRIEDYREIVAAAHGAGALAVVATDLLALTQLVPPGEFGADVAVGSAQRFGVPMGFGGPHAAFLSTRTEYVRKTPGRLIGVSRDSNGNPAYRMAIQTREQHIRRDRATSNICTAQVLLAIMAGMYATYHGPEGLRRIGSRVHGLTLALAGALRELGCTVGDEGDARPFFDTIKVRPAAGMKSDAVHAAAKAHRLNFRRFADGAIGIALDETVTELDLRSILECFGATTLKATALVQQHADLASGGESGLGIFARRSEYLTHPVFNTHHSETELLRYIFKLQSRDLSLAQSMIPLGSCTMKLNATSEMVPVTWSEFGAIHPFAPVEQTEGYRQLFKELESWLAEITGFAAVSLQPNAGSQGEYAGLLVIRAYHHSRGDHHRDVCLIPVSAHGTNPASAVMAGMKVVPVACDARGNVDLADLKAKATQYRNHLAALMVTYPSTHGVFEEAIREICAVVHEHGGMVYMDGANMNAQVGLTSPGFIGADVCHLNLHKTFCIPHGGGGPGMGPIGVVKALAPFLPGHPVSNPESAGAHAIGPISAAPYGSPSILTISWMYIAMMGAEGLTKATQVAILNANYMARRLTGSGHDSHYDLVYTNHHGLVAHEFILDCRAFGHDADVTVEDIAKRLMDYGFHAPTMSWPVPGTLMIEPTESEPKVELDRLCDALIAIRKEIRAVAEGRADRVDNVLKGAPHTAAAATSDAWTHVYSREEAAFPAPWTRDYKFWPHVGRVDNPYGDRNLVCTCPPVEAFDTSHS